MNFKFIWIKILGTENLNSKKFTKKTNNLCKLLRIIDSKCHKEPINLTQKNPEKQYLKKEFFLKKNKWGGGEGITSN